MIRQRLTKTITGAYTTTDADCGYRLICNSSTPFAITLHMSTGRFNFELEIDNIGTGAVTCGGQTILQGSHAHVGNNGGTEWVVVIGGGNLTLGETSATAYRGDRGKTAYDHSQSTHAPADAQKNSDITKAEIEAKLTGIITSHSHLGNGGSIYEPLVNGDKDSPELMFDETSDIIMVEV